MLTTGPLPYDRAPGPTGRGGARTRRRRRFRSSLLVAPRGQMDVLEGELLLVALRLALDSGELPHRGVGEALVVAPGLAVRRGVLDPQVPARRLLAGQRVAAHQLAELEEVRHPARLLERLVERLPAAQDAHLRP